METIHSYISGNITVAWLVLAASFVVLARCASIFVDGAVGIADRLGVPKLVIGIVLVSLATTAPELAVSMTAALKGNPEMALGNAIGSVICDDGLALAAAGLVAPTAIAVIPQVLRTSAIFLILIELLAFAFILPDYTLSRGEGGMLVLLFVIYMGFLFRQHRKGVLQEEVEEEEIEKVRGLSTGRMLLLFALGLGGIILASEFIVTSAKAIAESFHMPEAVISLTLIAFGTSIPEVATCITAARKNHGALAVGNILGADILNICWVAGASAMANDLRLQKKELFFMFPSMFIIVAVMLVSLRYKHVLTKKKSVLLLVLYFLYLAASFLLFPPTTTPG